MNAQRRRDVPHAEAARGAWEHRGQPPPAARAVIISCSGHISGSSGSSSSTAAPELLAFLAALPSFPTAAPPEPLPRLTAWQVLHVEALRGRSARLEELRALPILLLEGGAFPKILT